METTYNLVCEALQPVYEWAKTVDFNDRSHAGYENGPYQRTANMRFDCETIATRTKEQSLSLAFTQVRDDLMDGVTNGDVYHTSDPRLKCLDGEVKRGKRLSKIHISRADIYREYRPTHNVCEYTLFIVVYVEFE